MVSTIRIEGSQIEESSIESDRGEIESGPWAEQVMRGGVIIGDELELVRDPA